MKLLWGLKSNSKQGFHTRLYQSATAQTKAFNFHRSSKAFALPARPIRPLRIFVIPDHSLLPIVGWSVVHLLNLAYLVKKINSQQNCWTKRVSWTLWTRGLARTVATSGKRNNALLRCLCQIFFGGEWVDWKMFPGTGYNYVLPNCKRKMWAKMWLLFFTISVWNRRIYENTGHGMTTALRKWGGAHQTSNHLPKPHI